MGSQENDTLRSTANNYISQYEFNEIIDNVCKLASLAYSQKRNNDNKQLSPKVVMVFWVCTVFVLCFCLTSYYAAIEESTILRLISIGMLATSTIIFSIITLSVIFASIPEFPTLQTLVKEKVNQYFDNINQIYLRKGFWWRISPELMYIEMVIEENSGEVEYDKDNNMVIKRPGDSSTRKIAGGGIDSGDFTDPYSSRSKEKMKNNKVAPIDTFTTNNQQIGSLSPHNQIHNMTLQMLPMKKRSEFNNEENDDFSRKNSASDPYNFTKARSGGIINKKTTEETNLNNPTNVSKNKSIMDIERIPQKVNERSGFEPSQRVNSRLERYDSQKDESENSDESDNSQNISPGQILQNSPPENYQNAKQRSESPNKEDSMKMEDVLGEFENEQVKQRQNKNSKNQDNYGGKGKQYGFQDHENSNFGTEWMSEK